MDRHLAPLGALPSRVARLELALSRRTDGPGREALALVRLAGWELDAAQPGGPATPARAAARAARHLARADALLA